MGGRVGRMLGNLGLVVDVHTMAGEAVSGLAERCPRICRSADVQENTLYHQCSLALSFALSNSLFSRTVVPSLRVVVYQGIGRCRCCIRGDREPSTRGLCLSVRPHSPVNLSQQSRPSLRQPPLEPSVQPTIPHKLLS